MIFAEHHPEDNSGKRKSKPQSRIKYGDENIRHQSRAAKPYTAAHHKCHNAISFQIKKMPERPCRFQKSVDTSCMFEAHFKEHHAEH